MTLWILSVRVAPPITFLIPFFLMYRRLHLIDTYLGLILIYTSINLTLSIILVRGFFKDIPIESEESARLEGCSPLGVFLKISLPLALTGILATASLIFILTWNELLFALVLTNGHATTIPGGHIYLYRVQRNKMGPANGSFEFGSDSCISVSGTLTQLPSKGTDLWCSQINSKS